MSHVLIIILIAVIIIVIMITTLFIQQAHLAQYTGKFSMRHRVKHNDQLKLCTITKVLHCDCPSQVLHCLIKLLYYTLQAYIQAVSYSCFTGTYSASGVQHSVSGLGPLSPGASKLNIKLARSDSTSIRSRQSPEPRPWAWPWPSLG